MKKTINTLLVVLISVVVVAAFVAGFIVLNNNKPVEEEEKTNYEIIVGDEIDVYESVETRIAPYLVGDDGTIKNAKFSYSSSSDKIFVSADGKISIREATSETVYITVKENTTGAEKKVKINIILGLEDVLGVVDNSGSYITDKTQEFTLGETYTFTVVTEPSNVDIVALTSIKTIDKNGTEKQAFEIVFNRSEIQLKAIGLGSGEIALDINDKDGAKVYDSTFSFNIATSNKNLSDKILESSNETLLSSDDLQKIDTLKLDSQTTKISDISALPAVKTLVLTGNSVLGFEGVSNNYVYRVPEELFYSYCKDSRWAGVIDNIIPYKGDNEGAYVVYHLGEDKTVTYKEVSLLGSLDKYESEGYINVGWNDKDGNAVTVEQVKALKTNGIHLYAVWEPIKYNISYHVREFESRITNSIEEWTYETKKPLRTIEDFKTSAPIVKVGYKFIGWTDNSASSDKNSVPTYFKGTEYTQLTNVNNKTIHLYDVWEPVQYTIVFETVSGMAPIADKTVKYGEYYTLPVAVRPGYTFVGWRVSESITLQAGQVQEYPLASVEGIRVILTPIFN